MSYSNCQSCGMPIDAGVYCQYCSDASGKLHGFEEAVERMSQFMKRQEPTLSEVAARARTLEYMGTMPAWKDHPGLKPR